MTHRILAVCAVLGFAAVAQGQWKGTEETREGVNYVHNPAEPAQGRSEVQLEEVWRIGGYDDDEIFGVVVSIVEGSDGNFYLLDSQLNEIKVYSTEGDYLRTIGREGEGPGEFRFAFGHFEVPGGNLGVLQVFPPKIVMLTPEGDPAGEYPVPKFEGQGFQAIVQARHAGDLLAMMQVQSELINGGAGGFHRSEVLTLAPMNSDQATEVTRKTISVKTPAPEIRETDFFGMIQGRWDAFEDGRTVAAKQFADYVFEGYGADGKLQFVADRDYEPLARTKKQVDDAMAQIENTSAAQMPFPDRSHKVSDVHPSIMSVQGRADGSTWILSSRGNFEKPENANGIYDVYDAKGHFQQQVTLLGEGDPDRDGTFMVGDYVFVITDLVDAMQALQSPGAATEEDEADEDVEPMQVICYRLNAPKLGLN